MYEKEPHGFAMFIEVQGNKYELKSISHEDEEEKILIVRYKKFPKNLDLWTQYRLGEGKP